MSVPYIGMEIETMVEFFFCNDKDADYSQKVESRSLDDLDIPEKCYVFHFYDIVSALFSEGDGQHEIKLELKKINRSPSYYNGGTILSRKEVAKIKTKRAKQAFKDMELLNISHTIRCASGEYHPLMKRDIVLQRL